MAAVARREHVIMFPFMAQGHIIPFLALATQIHNKGYNITLITTPLNVKTLSSTNSEIRLLEIPFDSSEHGLPPDTENTDNLPYHLIFRLLEASASLKPAFGDLVKRIMNEELDNTPPLCIICDFFFGWTAEIARELNVYHAVFVGASGFGTAVYYSLWRSVPCWKGQSNSVLDEFENPDFAEGGNIHVSQLPASLRDANGLDSWSVFLGKRLPEWSGSNALLFNTVEEVDKVGLDYFRRKLGLPVFSIGPILFKKVGVTTHECLAWLDTKPPTSVLYICFGSQNTLTKSQMVELAAALEASKTPFIWVIRPPLGYNDDDECFPTGFEHRIQHHKMGLLVKKWAPQVEILSHKSVGGFVSHCGWNSVLEAISHGVPILGWPMAAEQFFNSKFLVEEVGVCVEIGRGNTCEIKHEDIKKKIEYVMGDEDVKRRAKEVMEVIQNAGIREGSSLKALDEFLNAAFLMKYKKSNYEINLL